MGERRCYTGLRHWVARLIVLGAFLIVPGSWRLQTALPVAAAGWSKNSYTYCNTYSTQGLRPWGTSVLDWNGYFVASSGESYGTIWQYNGTNWVIKGQGYGSDSGVDGSAVAESNAPYVTGELYTSGSHGSTFFSGWVDSYSPSAWC